MAHGPAQPARPRLLRRLETLRATRSHQLSEAELHAEAGGCPPLPALSTGPALARTLCAELAPRGARALR